MNDLAKTLNCLPSMNRIERRGLRWCAGTIGATPKSRRHKRFIGSGFHNLDKWQLHDLSVECRKLWIEGCKVIQTHLIENHDVAIRWNALWARLKELLIRKGVEMA